MFDFVRKHNRLFLGLILLLILPSFVVFGIQGYSGMTEGANAAVAKGSQDIMDVPQAVTIVTRLEAHYAEFDGLNLSWETVEGVIKHNGPVSHRLHEPAWKAIADYAPGWDLRLDTFASLEAQCAAIADDIAYNNHDVDDGVQAGLFSLDDLAEVPLIGLPVGNPIQQLIDLRLREMGRANEARTTFNHLHSVVAMVEAGYGAAVMPAFVQGACSRYAVQVSVMTAPEVPLDFYALSRKGTHTTEAARAFLAAFTAQLREYPQLQP